MISILAIGDPHFQPSNTLECHEFIKRVTRLVKEREPTFVVILGDLLHTHNQIYESALNMAAKLINNLAKHTEVYVIIGNHDYCNNQQLMTNKHAFNGYKGRDNITICDTVVTSDYGNFKFVFAPYMPNGYLIESLDSKSSEWKSATCVFAHQEIYGCKMAAIESTNGDVWEDDYPLLVSGHIHDTQWSQENVYYPGSCLQDFGEPVKTLAWLQWDRMGKRTVETIDLGMPRKKKIVCKVHEASKYKIENNSLIKLVIHDTPENILAFKKSQEHKHLLANKCKIGYTFEKMVQSGHTPSNKQNIIDICRDLVAKEKNKYMTELLNSIL